jgi:hypothetical protein
MKVDSVNPFPNHMRKRQEVFGRLINVLMAGAGPAEVASSDCDATHYGVSAWSFKVFSMGRKLTASSNQLKPSVRRVELPPAFG